MRQMNQLSLESYRSKVKPNITNMESVVLEALEEIYPASAEMVANHMKITINRVSGRITGLRKKNLIVVAYKAHNPAGNLVAFWMPNNAEPGVGGSY